MHELDEQDKNVFYVRGQPSVHVLKLLRKSLSVLLSDNKKVESDTDCKCCILFL